MSKSVEIKPQVTVHTGSSPGAAGRREPPWGALPADGYVSWLDERLEGMQADRGRRRHVANEWHPIHLRRALRRRPDRAATLPPETWRGGEFDLNDYLIEAMQVGIIGTVDVDGEDGYSEPEAAEPGA